MKKRASLILIFLIIILGSNYILAQTHISGTIEVNMNTGVFNCDVTLSNMPKLKDYRILLNKGMNIKYFKDHNGRLLDYDGHYNGEMKGEGIEYIIKKDTTFTLNEIGITYTGAFPVYVNDYSKFDYKGIIAFNKETVRATEQTKWYPVIYDYENDKLINSYTYSLTISIVGGEAIFLNGSAPQKGSKAHFSSQKPRPLLLFAGNYDFISYNGDYILNTNVTEKDAKIIFNNIQLIKNNLYKNIGIAFTDNIYLISHKAINQRKKGSSWGFNTYPSFAFTGLNFDNLINETGEFHKHHLRYFAHEFGHNYFGNNVISGKLKWFWLESFAEYLSYTVAEDLVGKEFLKEVLKNRLKNIKETDTFIPLTDIKNTEEIGEKYRYILAPLMLKCFEDKFGRKTMNQVIRSILEFAENETLTMQHFKKSAIKNGVSKEEFETFTAKYISDRKFSQNIINAISEKYD